MVSFPGNGMIGVLCREAGETSSVDRANLDLLAEVANMTAWRSRVIKSYPVVIVPIAGSHIGVLRTQKKTRALVRAPALL
jgi:hypothetical protein